MTALAAAVAMKVAQVGSVAVLVLAAAFFVVTTPTGHLPAPAAAAPPPPTGATVTSRPGVPAGTATSAHPSGATSTPPTTPLSSAPRTLPTGAGTPATGSEASSPGAPCIPSGLTVPALGIDTSVVKIGLQPDGTLGTPTDADKTRVGWYPSVLAGSAHGTVIMDGHTYHDDSAVFKMSFAQAARVGMDIRLSCAHRPVIAYRVSQLHLDLTPSAYPGFVESQQLYAAGGPPRLVLITCTDWDPSARVWQHRGVLIATPLP